MENAWFLANYNEAKTMRLSKRIENVPGHNWPCMVLIFLIAYFRNLFYCVIWAFVDHTSHKMLINLDGMMIQSGAVPSVSYYCFVVIDVA